MANKQVTLKRVIDTSGNTDTIHPTTHWNQIESKPSTFTPTSHTHTLSDISDVSALKDNTHTKHDASDLAVGWYTIATNTGNRAIARFGLRDTDSSRHQSVIFYAAHHYGNDDSNTITVLHNSRFGTSPFRYIRIKEGGTYDGAALQIYIDNAQNNVRALMLGDNFQSSGWVLKDWIADAIDPGDVDNWASMTEKGKIDLDQIDQGGIATTGNIYAGGNTTQYKVLTTNDSVNADTLDSINSTQFLRSDTSDTMTGNLTIDSASFASLTLDRESTTSSSIVQFTNNGGVVGGVGGFGNDGLQFRTADGTQMVIDSSNNVGINEDSPHEKLTVATANARSDLAIYRSGSNVSSNTNVGRLTFDTDYNSSPMIVGEVIGRTTEDSAFRGSLDFRVKSTSGGILTGMTVYGTLSDGPRVGIGTTTPSKELDVNGNMIISGDNRYMTFGTPGAGTTTGARFFSIEGNTDTSGEGSGRIFFTEHNSSTAGMDKYGMSLGYRGGASSIIGASGNTWSGLGQIGNGQWGMWGHNNSEAGALVMSGDRAATYIDFHSNELRNTIITNKRYFDTYRADTIDSSSEDFDDFTTSGTYAVNNWSQSGDVVQNGPTNSAAGNAYGWGMLRVTNFQSSTGTGDGYVVQEYIPHVSDTHYVRFQWNGTWTTWRAAWGSDNDGAGSGLDADLLDGVQGSSYLRSDADDNYNGILSLGSTSTIKLPNSAQYGIRTSTGHRVIDSVDSTLRIGDTGKHSLITLHGQDGDDFRVYYGATHYNIWHEGNDGVNSGLDADKLRGYLPAEGASANSIAKRDGNGDLKVNDLIIEHNGTGTAADSHAVRFTARAAGLDFTRDLIMNESGNLEFNGTQAELTDTQLTTEQVQDIVGGMVTGNTESGITVTYQDSDGTLDFSVSGGGGNTWTEIKTGSTTITSGTTATSVALAPGNTVDDTTVLAFELNSSSVTSYTSQIFIVKLEDSNSSGGGILFNAQAHNSSIQVGSVRVFRTLSMGPTSTSVSFSYSFKFTNGSSSEIADTIYIGKIWKLGVTGA